jgi:hypothetical protein
MFEVWTSAKVHAWLNVKVCRLNSRQGPNAIPYKKSLIRWTYMWIPFLCKTIGIKASSVRWWSRRGWSLTPSCAWYNNFKGDQRNPCLMKAMSCGEWRRTGQCKEHWCCTCDWGVSNGWLGCDQRSIGAWAETHYMLQTVGCVV